MMLAIVAVALRHGRVAVAEHMHLAPGAAVTFATHVTRTATGPTAP